MLKKYLLGVVVLFSMSGVFGQSLTHGLGFGSNYYNVRSEKISNTPFGGKTIGLNYLFGAGLSYRLSLGFDLNKKVSFAVTTYPYLGAELKTYGDFNDQVLLGAELPVLAEFYFGHGNVNDEAYFIGWGVTGFHLATIDDPTAGIGHTFNGFQFSTGGQFYMMGSLMQLRLSYNYGTQKTDIPTDVAIVRNHGVTFSWLGTFKKRSN